MLTERSQSQKTNTVWFHLHEVLWVVKNHRDRKQNGGCQELGDGSLGDSCSMGIVSVLQDEKSSGDGWWEDCTRIPMYLISLNCTLKNG